MAFLAQAYLVGMPGLQMINSTKLIESIAMSAALKKAHEIREREMEVQADMITNKIVTAWNKGQKNRKG